MENCRSKKLPLSKTKNQLSSFWGLAMHKNVSDAKNLRKMVDKKSKACQQCTDIEESCKIKVKDIMQEEFPTEKQWKKLLKSIKDQQKRIDFDQSVFDQSPRIGNQCLIMGDESSSDTGEVPRSISPRFGQFDQMSAKAFVDHIYKNRSINESKPFSDASEVLRLKRELFLKLLEEPNSPVVRHMQNLQFPNSPKDKRCLPSSAESTLKMQKKNMNRSHLWKKLKDRYGFSFKGSSCSGNGIANGNEIVVLHPISRIRNRVENVPRKRQKSKAKSFSLKEIRKKFKDAVGESRKDQHLPLKRDETRIMEMQKPLSLVRVLQNRTELKKSNSKKEQIDVLSEAKKHLSERLKRGNVAEILPRKQAVKTLEMILSSPDHSPRGEPLAFSDTQELSHKGQESIKTTESSEDNRKLVDFREDDHSTTCLDTSKGREGHPSPVSVLEHGPFSPADTNSPTSTTHEPSSSGSPLQPRKIDFDDDDRINHAQDSKIDVSTCIEEGDQDYISAYVRAVMQASEMSFSTSSLPLGPDSYDPFNSLGLFQVGTNLELNLLLDCIHESLVEVYCRCFGFLKPTSIRNAGDLKQANVVEKVVKEMHSLLFQELRKVDQIVCRDVAKSGSWFDHLHGHDAEEIVVRIAEDVLQDSVVDAIHELQLILS